MKKFELSQREREILSLVNSCLNLGVTAKSQDTTEGIYEILITAWDTPLEVLHDLGIGRFKVALMLSKLGLHGFVSQWHPQNQDVFFSFE